MPTTILAVDMLVQCVSKDREMVLVNPSQYIPDKVLHAWIMMKECSGFPLHLYPPLHSLLSAVSSGHAKLDR